MIRYLLLSLVVLSSLWAQKPTVTQLLEEYGGGPFDAKRGEAMWFRAEDVQGQKRSCTTCHRSDLSQSGEHAETGKAIDPMAPSITATRFDDLRHTRKWFRRNCKWVYGRECTNQEKGDFVLFILSQ
jgi:hypothetical protein